MSPLGCGKGARLPRARPRPGAGPVGPPPTRSGTTSCERSWCGTRITDLYLRRELADGGRLDPAVLAAEVGTTAAVARQPSPPALLVLGSGTGGWRPLAARSTPSCSSPTRPGRPGEGRVRRLWGPGAVSGGRPCAAPQAHQDHAGIFAGTTPGERVRLRGRASMAQGTRFLQDGPPPGPWRWPTRSASTGPPAARVSKQALRCASDHHGPPQPHMFRGGPEDDVRPGGCIREEKLRHQSPTGSAAHRHR
jgi:hypothetical protein